MADGLLSCAWALGLEESRHTQPWVHCAGSCLPQHETTALFPCRGCILPGTILGAGNEQANTWILKSPASSTGSNTVLLSI